MRICKGRFYLEAGVSRHSLGARKSLSIKRPQGLGARSPTKGLQGAEHRWTTQAKA